MASRFSTGLVNAMLDSGSFASVMSNCVIDFYTGVQPSDPDNAPTGTLLATVSSGGTNAAIVWEATGAVGNELKKSATDTWTGNTVAAGQIGWFRMRDKTDTNAVSTSFPRVDGAVGLTGAEINLGNVVVDSGAPLSIQQFSVTLPRT